MLAVGADARLLTMYAGRCGCGAGFPRLTDLGLCAVIPAEGKLFQHCGTRSYMGTLSPCWR